MGKRGREPVDPMVATQRRERARQAVRALLPDDDYGDPVGARDDGLGRTLLAVLAGVDRADPATAARAAEALERAIEVGDVPPGTSSALAAVRAWIETAEE